MTNQKHLGILLIVLGIVCALALVAYSVYHANNMWDLEMKARTFDSFADYYFASSKGILLVSGFIGLSLILWGVECIRGYHRRSP